MSNLKAVILAGGLGTRLRPLTLTKPKPLCTVLSESVLERLLRQLSDLKINKAGISTMYLSEQIKEKLGERFSGVILKYVTEPSPLGSAGGAKYTAKALGISDDDIFIILSGDGIFDFNLEDAVKFHTDTDADVTIVSYNTKNPLEYGVILSDNNGKIYAFSEKPAWEKVRSDSVNTGIYIIKGSVFKDIPEGREFDFSKDLFPYLLGNRKKLYSFNMKGYWCDIGDISAYYRCNIDALNGKIGNINLENSLSYEELAEKGVNLSSPCYISKNCVLSEKASIVVNSIILDGTKISNNAKILGSIIFQNCIVGENSEINNSIICENVKIGKNVKIMPGCTIGAGTVVCDNAVVTEGLCIWPEKIIEKGFYVTEDVLFENKSRGFYTDDGLFAGNISEAINSDYITKLGRAVAMATFKSYKENHIAKIGIMHDEAPESALVAETLLCGIKSTGAMSYSFLSGFEAQAKYVAASFMTDIVLFVTKNENERLIKIFDSMANTPSRDFERKIEASYKNPSLKRSVELYETKYIDSIGLFYYSTLIRSIYEEYGNKDKSKGLLSDIKCCFPDGVKKGSANYIVLNILSELGAEISEDFCEGTVLISISENGTSAVVEERTENRRTCLDTYHIASAIISYGLKNGNPIYSLPHFAKPLFYGILNMKNPIGNSSLKDKSNIIKHQYISEIRKINDMCFAVINLLCILKTQNKTLGELSNELPTFEIRIRNISNEDTYGENRAPIMKHLYEKYGETDTLSENDGIKVDFESGSVNIIPRRTGGFRLITEALNAEFAEELSARFFDEIKDISKKCSEE